MVHEEDDENFDNYPITYSIDNQIIMHRDVHFGGDFAAMLDYYKNQGRGIHKEFELSRIEELAQLEQQSRRNLATFMLSGAEAEKIAQAKQIYKNLRDLYAFKNQKNQIPRVIADLILAESADVDAAIEAVVAEKSAIVPALVDLLRNEEFFDPLFPGYGLAPVLAAQCLGKIGDKRALISLFETLGEGDFFNDDAILTALHAIGEPAKAFLLKVMHAKPINRDNEQAAIALVQFKDDEQVSIACLEQLKAIDLKTHEAFATYLVLACAGLPKHLQQEFVQLAKHPNTPKVLKQDIQVIVKSWEEFD